MDKVCADCGEAAFRAGGDAGADDAESATRRGVFPPEAPPTSPSTVTIYTVLLTPLLGITF